MALRAVPFLLKCGRPLSHQDREILSPGTAGYTFPFTTLRRYPYVVIRLLMVHQSYSLQVQSQIRSAYWFRIWNSEC